MTSPPQAPGIGEGDEGFDRPSVHGKILGDTLSMLEAAGRAIDQTIPASCATCAFRHGSDPNLSAGTGLIAFKCAVGVDKGAFCCHHGLKEGQPTMVCAGWLAAQKAPFDTMKALTFQMNERLAAMDGTDPIREAYDAWLETIDPAVAQDTYARARAWLKHGRTISEVTDIGGGDG